MFQVSEVSDTDLKFGRWYIANQDLLKSIGIGLLIAFDVLLMGYVLYGSYQAANFIYFGSDKLVNQIIADKPSFESVSKTELLPMAILDTFIIPGKDNKYDLLAKVRNPNADFALFSFNYRFNLGNTETEYSSGFLLPGEEKYLMVLGYGSDAIIASANLEVGDLNYQRVRNYEALKAERYDFLIKDPMFVPPKETGVSNKISVSEVNFSVVNQSIYNFWDLGMQILLKRGTKVVGANYLKIDQIKSMEEIKESVKWFDDVSGVTSVEIIPEMNILDETFIQQQKSLPGEIK